ncbi:cysteine peptidase family C39 domain-containing protein [Pirellulaceae bacterium SH501]
MNFPFKVLATALSSILLFNFTYSSIFADTSGSECLYLSLRVFKPEGTPLSFQKFQRQLGKVPKDGYSLADLREIAQKRGLFAEYLNCDIEDLEKLVANRLAILFVTSKNNQGHFVLCKTMSDQMASIYDPTGDLKGVSKARLGKIWEGKGLLVSETPIDLHSGQQKSPFFLYSAIGAAALAASSFILLRMKK